MGFDVTIAIKYVYLDKYISKKRYDNPKKLHINLNLGFVGFDVKIVTIAIKYVYSDKYILFVGFDIKIVIIAIKYVYSNKYIYFVGFDVNIVTMAIKYMFTQINIHWMTHLLLWTTQLPLSHLWNILILVRNSLNVNPGGIVPAFGRK